MKSTVNQQKPKNFPKLQQALNQTIFLMSTPTKGTVINSKSPANIVGTYFIDLNPEDLADFAGSITLEN